MWLWLVGCAEEEELPADDSPIVCVEEPEEIDACAVTGPVCTLAALDLAATEGTWRLDTWSGGDELHFRAPGRFEVEIELRGPLADSPPGDLSDRVDDVWITLPGLHLEAPVPFGAVSAVEAWIEALEVTAGGVRMVATASAVRTTALDRIESSERGCRQGDEIGRCACDWEVPATVRIEVEAPLGG